MKGAKKIDKTWIGILLAAVAAVAGPFGLAVGIHSHPVGHHSHPIPLPRIVLEKTADHPRVPIGDLNGYAVTVTNVSPILRGVVLELIDTLPEGFEYLDGSTSGAIVEDPVVDGRKLRWRGPFHLNHSSSMEFHFEVRVSTRPGRYFNVMDGRVRRPFTVTGTGQTAPILVGVATELVARASLLRDAEPALKYTARLTSRGRPLANKLIEFSVFASPIPSGSLICSAVTNSNGVAECTGVIELIKGVPRLGWEAVFEGGGIYAPSSDHGDLIE
jgi:uncharacterized repeat protein (TIGR01451 family)